MLKSGFEARAQRPGRGAPETSDLVRADALHNAVSGGKGPALMDSVSIQYLKASRSGFRP